MDGATAVDTGYESGADAPPGVCEGEADAEEGEPGVVAFEGGGVAHLRKGEGICIEGGGFGVGGGVGGGDIGLFVCHG